MLSPRINRMMAEMHQRLGITSSQYQPMDSKRGTFLLTTPDGLRYVVVDTQDGLWYEVWRGQPVPAERSSWE